MVVVTTESFPADTIDTHVSDHCTGCSDTCLLRSVDSQKRLPPCYKNSHKLGELLVYLTEKFGPQYAKQVVDQLTTRSF